MAILVLIAIRAKLKAGLKTKPGGSHENLIDLSHNSQFFGFLIGLYAILIPFFLPKENKQLHFVGGTICVLMGFYHVMTFVNSYPVFPDFFNSQSFVF